MGLLGAIWFYLVLLSLTQIPYVNAQTCKITSTISPDAGSLKVKWESYPGATNYFLDLRVINSTSIAPVVVTLSSSSTEKVVQGLRPGTRYSVTLKVFQFYYVVCMDTQLSLTVPTPSQITYSKALSSTAIQVSWDQVASADNYYLVVETIPGERFNLSFTTNFSTVIEHLRPSTSYNFYIYTANAAGLGEISRVRTTYTLVQPPKNISAVQTDKRKARVRWQPVDNVLMYRVTVRDLRKPQVIIFQANSSTVMVDIVGILPCSTYLISVSSINTFLEPGESTDYIYTTNPLSPVTSIHVDYSCDTGSAIISWPAVFNADSYRVEAVRTNGTVLNCLSNGTNCVITVVDCGQSFVVHVIAISQGCESSANYTMATFQTVPCSPSNLQLFRECSSNVIIFSWQPTNATDYYVSQAVDSKGMIQDCMTTETSCFFTDTYCGRHYTFSVYAVSGLCNGKTSASVGINTAPCMPLNMQTLADCHSQVLISTWDLAEGALSYFVDAWGNTVVKNRYNCSSSTTSCSIDGVQCGDDLTVYITAYDDMCSSARTLGQAAGTVPCIPQNVSANANCSADSVTVNWNMAAGAVFYIASARDSLGMIHTCTSSFLACQIKNLTCGTNYTVSVISSNMLCNSSDSVHLSVNTVSCPAANVMAYLDCDANMALIGWQRVPNVMSYTATLIDTSGGLLSCSTIGTSCNVTNLKCSQHYAVSVLYHDGTCPSMPSQAFNMDSVPCGPASVQANLSCVTGQLDVAWLAARVAVSRYVVVIAVVVHSGRLQNNQTLYFNSTQPQYSVNSLECGQAYTVLVRSVTGTCQSFPSNPVTIMTEPCVPTGIVASRSCGDSSVNVTWQASNGASSYRVVAAGVGGNSSVCLSNTTACQLGMLMCGQVYNITVVAIGDTCSSVNSAVVTVQTVPCPPAQLAVSLDCALNSATVTWTASSNAVTYSAKGVGTDGHTASCNTTGAMLCQLRGLHCGQAYIFSVAASDGSCSSPDCKQVSLVTAPCVPQNTAFNITCKSNGTCLHVSWQPSSSAVQVNYTASAVTGSGAALYCTTAGSGCDIMGLLCGLTYSLTVQGSTAQCVGQSSAPMLVSSVPCAPANLLGSVACESSTLQASWGSAAGALAYISTLSGAGGFSTSMSTNVPASSFPNLLCANQYTLTVVAFNNLCNSTMSTGLPVVTAPCPPQNAMAVLNCNTGGVMVSWKTAPGALSYTAYTTPSGATCSSSGTSCELQQLPCGGIYVVTVLAQDGRCNSTATTTATVKTAPCPPLIQDTTLNCSSNCAKVSWSPTVNANSFSVSVVSTLQHSSSCTSNTTGCMLNLLCGNTYTGHVVAQGDVCQSSPSAAFNFFAAPCTPANLISTYTCGTAMAMVSWDETLGRDRFSVLVQAGTSQFSCSTMETYCSFTSLLCGLNYTATVNALSSHCNSSQPGSTQIQTAPCAPQNVSASLTCANNTAAVSWLASPGATSYSVSALGRDGDSKQCSSNTTGCLLPNMHCGQIYEITVTPASNTCTGFASSPFTYTTGPCAPTGVQASLRCQGNVGVVSWDLVASVELYVATAMTLNHSHTCRSNTTGCSLTDLQCGQSYAVTVVAMERGCRSDPSSPVSLHTVICPPTEVVAKTACSTNDITVSWSPNEAISYLILYQNQSGYNMTYSTASATYVTTGLQCGETFAVSVAAKDSVCTSVMSRAIDIDTAPCPPRNISVSSRCGVSMGTVFWNPSPGALTYTATVNDTSGRTASCSTNGTSCSVHLDCGCRYSVVLMAYGLTCNSSLSSSIMFTSAPCLPANVSAVLDCNTNSFAVRWLHGIGPYMAMAIGSDESRLSCNTSFSACNITSLTCGLTYSIIVTMPTIDCGFINETDYKIKSAPCKPGNASVQQDCNSDMALVKWTNTPPGQLSVVTATDRQGKTIVCNSTCSNCTLQQLRCGQTYTLSVLGHTDTCDSQPSSSLTLVTDPCVPSRLLSSVDCTTGIVLITWDTALGATGYTVYANDSGGHVSTCASTDTTCAFNSLACGKDHNITVVAYNAFSTNRSCTSLGSNHITATTVPCSISNLQANVDCWNNTATVSWTPGTGILSYHASAAVFNGVPLTCSTNGSACNISSLQCGQRYTVTVNGNGHVCPSTSGYWKTINTAPCPPTQVSIHSTCQPGGNISVSWQPSDGSVSYRAVAVNYTSASEVNSCNTTGTACMISGLQCGQMHQVHVVGLDEHCVGAKSDVYINYTAPCVPYGIQVHLDCLSSDLNVTWQHIGAAQGYYVTLQSASGSMLLCNTVQRHCAVSQTQSGLQCGQLYTVVVTTYNQGCNSSQSLAFNSAPCVPQTFSTEVDCLSGAVAVRWVGSPAGALYTVSAVAMQGPQYNCSSTGTQCDLTHLECGTAYTVTITASNGTCVGTPSLPQTVQTVPCVPALTTVEMDCLSEAAWVMWDEAAGAEFYVVMITDSTAAGRQFMCNNTESSCLVPEMTCGQSLDFTISASNTQCSSSPSNSINMPTAPCAPESVQATTGCTSHTATVSWLPSWGALTYTATLEATNGSTTCCTTTGTSCDVRDLPCGMMYVVLVTAEGSSCNSSQSLGIMTRTEPCVPQALVANMSCSTNVATMTWNYSMGGQQYVVEAVSAAGQLLQCTSYMNSCSLEGLPCGQTYTASVVAQNSDCSSAASSSVAIKTVPCTPANVSTLVHCDTNSLQVWWSASPGAAFYTAWLQDSDGHSTTCHTDTQLSCNISGLSCGQVYHASVVASDSQCSSPYSSQVDTNSVPCIPSNINAIMECDTRLAVVWWQMAAGALSYNATARSTSGSSVVTCSTSNTSCDLAGLACGQSYSVSVHALGQSCCSTASMTSLLVTDPCVPQHITTTYSLSIGQVSWDMSQGATSYTAEGVTQQGLTVSCNSSDTSCSMYPMACSQTYNVTVTARNQVCFGSVISSSTAVKTEPCPPKYVQAHLDCASSGANVSWEMSMGAVGYVAFLDGRDGSSLSCQTTDTYCSVQALHCGTVYYTQVVALGPTLNSSSSTSVLLVSAPCMAVNMQARVDCAFNTAFLLWNWMDGATNYSVAVHGSDGHTASCETANNNCILTELGCGQTYNVSMTVINGKCQKTVDTNVNFNSSHCAPKHVGVDLACGSSTAKLSWEPQPGVQMYTATAMSMSGKVLYCNSTNPTCQFPHLPCGGTYHISVTASTSTCHSNSSSIVSIQTEPCQPSNLTVTGSYGNGTVELGWSPAMGASAYVVTAQGSLGYMTEFHTNVTHTNMTHVKMDLPCGQTYNCTVKSKSDDCSSPDSQHVHFSTAPCVPTQVQTYIQCENNIGAVSWGPSDGAEYYTAVAVGRDGHTHMCTTNTTYCMWTDLHCSELYMVHVVASNMLGSSAPSNSSSIIMDPCVPTILQSSLDCNTKMVSLSWNASEAATSYNVTAQTNSGQSMVLSTSATSAQLSGFLCGQQYFLSVQAAGSVCISSSSQPATISSVPCPPRSISSSMDCLTNIAVISWVASAGAEFYTAHVQNQAGQSVTCLSDKLQCGTTLRCGLRYTVTVTASNQQCSSDPSPSDMLQSVPCVPAGVTVSLSCSSNTAVVSWEASQGALSYNVIAQNMAGGMSTCSSSSVSCTLTTLVCGESYLVQVVAKDHLCSSLPSQAAVLNAVPCTPVIGEVLLDCITNSILLEWTGLLGATSYTVMAHAALGQATCTTNDTSCEVLPLQCSQTYTLTLVASNGECASNVSASVQMATAPCPPAGVQISMDCASSAVRVQWQESVGADSYLVQAMGMQEDTAGCETDSTSCIVPYLVCGFTYSISVFAINSQCNTSESAVTQLDSVPCVPKHVQASLYCETGDISVTWEPSTGAVSYSTVALVSNGYELSCNSTDTMCQFFYLPEFCGLSYSISVIAASDQCTSAKSNFALVYTVPCNPHNVASVIQCNNDTALVSWEQGEGVSSYRVLAFGQDGHQLLCSTNGTSCELPSMHCGEEYNVTVAALDGQCDNKVGYTLQKSVPCSPTNVQASLQCLSNSAAVTWEHASGALSYVAQGVVAGSQAVVCSNTDTSCVLGSLLCGQTYNVSVHALDNVCQSVESGVAYVHAAPCAPQSVLVSVQCTLGVMVVSWAPNPDAQSFKVSGVSNTGNHASCVSSSNSCSLSNLPCGQSYNITVVAVRNGCSSPPSRTATYSTAPCVPANPMGSLDCVTNSAWVSWLSAAGALSYTVLANGTGGHNSSCSSTSTHCNVPELACSTAYTFTVIAVNGHCQNANSTTFQLETGPCSMKNITLARQCYSDAIHVSWEITERSPIYMVSAEGHDNTFINCNSSSTSCVLAGARCGIEYTVIVSTSSDKCSSLRSSPQKIQTEPCVPGNITVAPSCEHNGHVVSWDHSAVASSFLLSATGRDGDNRTCNSSVSNCTLSNLRCGQPYTFNIIARGNNCSSQASTNVTFSSVPCAPSGLSANMDCTTNSAMVTWTPKVGSAVYHVHAQTGNGTALYCQSTHTSCNIQGLNCGSIYNFSVEASDGFCNGSLSVPLQAGAVPCPPVISRVYNRIIDGNPWLRVWWHPVNCSEEYLVEISGSTDDDSYTITSYWTNRTYFEFKMLCTCSYNFTVRSRNQAGIGNPSVSITGVTISCPPQNVTYTGNMQSATVSWQPSVLATFYTVYSPQIVLCNTTALSCHVSGVAAPNITVTARNVAGESLPSAVAITASARRRRELHESEMMDNRTLGLSVPQVIEMTVSGLSMYVEWMPVRDATNYRLVVKEEQANHPTVKTTVVKPFHTVSDLKPSTSYCVFLSARSTASNSAFSQPKCITTSALP